MPSVIQGQTLTGDITRVDYEYDYPRELNLKPGSKLHEHIKTEILRRARESREKMDKRFKSWNAIDEILTAYVDTDEEEKDIKSEDPRKPVSIVFPYSYAIKETLLTYLVMAFFQDPIFRYEGVSPEDVIGAILLEKTIELHCSKTKVPLNLYAMFDDSLRYGIGVVAPTWRVREGKKTVKQTRGLWSALYNKMIEGSPEKGTLEGEVLFEGNALENIDPYLYLPDPNVAAHDVQRGEFNGWVSKDNRMSLLREEKISKNGDLFNIKYLQHVQAKGSQFGDDKSGRQTKFGASKVKDEKVVNPVDVIYMYIDLIPEDWEIGGGKYPEKWLFGLANDAVVIKAKPLGLNHNMYPLAVCAPESDGYSHAPISKIEVLRGLQGVLDWLFNSHVANVRKAINDMLVVDPYLINIADLKDPKPGKLVRMRRPAWGRGVEKAVQQLAVQDITRANIEDSQWIVQWMQKIAGADDPMMGALRRGGPERLTRGEFQGTRVGAVSRLERVAKIVGLQAMQDIGYMFAVHAQQMMKKETWVKVTGRWQEDLINEYGINVERGRIKVSPLDIIVDYDVFVRDGSIPGSNFSELWLQMFKLLVETEGLGRQFDIVRIFKHIARSLGAKNVNDFVKVRPDEEVLREAEKGNIRPLGEA